MTATLQTNRAVALSQALVILQKEAPELLPISRSTVFRLVKAGAGPASVRRIGARLFVSPADLRAWAQQLGKQAATAQK